MSIVVLSAGACLMAGAISIGRFIESQYRAARALCVSGSAVMVIGAAWLVLG